MQVKERIAAFRKRMTEQGIAVAIVPTADSHASEYLADHFKVRQWLCGFTGSAGTLVVAREEAALFTDGRYFIQAQNQLAGSGVELMRMGTAGTPSLEAYVDALTQAGDTVGVDFSVISAQFAQAMRGRLEKRGVKLADTGDWFDALWTDRPPMPQQKAFLLEEGYAGRSVQSKLEAIRGEMKRQGAAVHVCNVLDDIAWTLNVRGGDVLYTPVVMSYLVVGEQDAAWFVEESKVEDALRAALCEAGVAVRGYGEITDALSRLAPGTRVLADGRKLTAALMAALAHTEVVQHENPAMRIKAHKNEVELANLRRAHVKDGLAVTHLMYWLKTRVGKEPMTERSVSDRLLALRAEQENFISPSFSTICAYRDHAAMMHYSATPETDVPLEPRDLLLIDSGGQYLEGTTDITVSYTHLDVYKRQQGSNWPAQIYRRVRDSSAKARTFPDCAPRRSVHAAHWPRRKASSGRWISGRWRPWWGFQWKTSGTWRKRPLH